MREIVFKNLTSVNARKKDILLKEVSQKDGIVTKTERRSFYFIKDITHVDGEADLQKWLYAKNQESPQKRHFYIFKDHNDKRGSEKIVCKIAGTFYVIVDNNIFTIAFLHSFRVTLGKEELVK